MTLTYRVAPLTDPASLAGETQVSEFTASWTQTLALLERELDHLGATDVVFELAVVPGQLTKGGQLRARTRATSGAVRISFQTSKHGALSYGTAAFVRGAAKRWRNGSYVEVMEHDWQHNVRAIALGLEALRTVERYRIGEGRQYAGWAALPPGSGAVAMGGMTRERAAELLEQLAIGDDGERRVASVAVIARGGEDAARAYRHARGAAHPDRRNGDRTLWDEVEEAAKVLGLAR